MYITRLHVKNMKLMRDLALDFTHEGQPRMWTAFVAENGACKTTLLQAIALAASGPDRSNQLADIPSLPDVRRAGETVQVGADFEFGTRLEKWRLFPKSKVSVEGERALRLRSAVRIEPEQSTFSGDSWFAPTGALESSSDFTWYVDEAKTALLASYHELKGDDWVSFSHMLSRVLEYRSPMIEARAKSFPGWFVAGYGTQRQLPVPLSVSELKDRVLNRLEPLFGKAPLVGTGFANQFADTPRFEPFIAALKKVFVDISTGRPLASW